MMNDVLDRRIHEAGLNQIKARGCAPQKKPSTWQEIDDYAEWIAAIRVREALLSLKEEVTNLG